MPAPRHRWAALWRSTPVRQALGLVAILSVINLLTFGLAYLTLRADQLASLRQSLVQEVAGFDVTATPGALATLVDVQARASDPKDRIYAFLGSDGRRAGNANARFDGTQLVLSARAGHPPLGDGSYLHEIRRLSGGVLIVAVNLEPVEDLSETFLFLLLLNLGPTILISLGAGVLIARRVARRVEGIEATLEQVAQGNLDARLSLSGTEGDDLARIGTGINRMAERQQQATEALRQVTSDIAHDLRTPLQRISVQLNALSERLPQDTPEAAMAERASEEAQRAVAVFQALLTIAQIESGSPKEQFRTFDLNALASQFAELYEPAAETAGKALRLTTSGIAAEVTGNRDLIGQVLANLVENALRHSGDGKAISIEVSVEDDAVTLSVADDGPGIPEEERQNVLRRLYRLERSRTTPGHGLGLSLASAVASLHGARLDLSDNNPGLRISLCFSIRQSAASRPPKAEPNPDDRSHPTRSGRRETVSGNGSNA